MPFGDARKSFGRGERGQTEVKPKAMSSRVDSNTTSVVRGSTPRNSSSQWCTSSFGRPMGNAGWGAISSIPGSSGDHNGNCRPQSEHPSSLGSGWGQSSSWDSAFATTIAETSHQTRPSGGNMYVPDHGAWAPNHSRAMGGWDSSMIQPVQGPARWDNAPPLYGPNAQPSYGAPPPYQNQLPPSSQCPPSATNGWPTQASFQMPHQPVATPMVAQHRSQHREPAIGAGPPVLPPPSGQPAPQFRPPSTVLPEPGAAGDAAQQPVTPSARLTTDTRVVCGPLSRLAALPAEPRRWLVLMARLEEAPTAGGAGRRFAVREPDGTRTECVYYELERPLPALQTGKWVRCVGRLDARGVFVCVTARLATRQDIGLHRQLQQLAMQPAAVDT